MALTITDHPGAWNSAHSDLIYTVMDEGKVSDPVTYPNFKFIADVYIGLVLVSRLKIIPDPSTGVGIVNIGMIVRSYVSSFFDPVPNVLLAQEAKGDTFYTSVKVKFGEEWNYTPTYDIEEYGYTLIYNSYEPRGQRGVMATIANQVASNRPAQLDVFFGSQALFIPFFAFATPAIPVPIIITPTGGGFPLSTSFTPSETIEMALLNLAPNVINSLQPGTITPATTSYTIQIAGRALNVRLICEAIYTPYAVHFLNQYGGFDTKFFTKVSRNTVTVMKTDYGRLPYSVDGAGAISFKSNNGVFIEQDATYASLYQEKMLLNTDFLTDEEYVWLRELLISPLVYIEDTTGIYVVKITDTDYEAKKVINDDLTNLTINVQFGTQQNAQYR